MKLRAEKRLLTDFFPKVWPESPERKKPAILCGENTNKSSMERSER
jgi:hypothetical protein